MPTVITRKENTVTTDTPKRETTVSRFQWLAATPSPPCQCITPACICLNHAGCMIGLFGLNPISLKYKEFTGKSVLACPLQFLE